MKQGNHEKVPSVIIVRGPQYHEHYCPRSDHCRSRLPKEGALTFQRDGDLASTVNPWKLGWNGILTLPLQMPCKTPQQLVIALEWAGRSARGASCLLKARQPLTETVMAAAASQGRQQDWMRFVYVTRFGSHQCGGVLQLGGRRAQGLWGRESGAGCRQEKPTEATAVPGVPGGGELPPGSRPRVPAAPGVAVAASASSSSSQLRASSGRSSTRPVACAGLIQKDAATKFDFPIPLNEASKIMKKKKKLLVWNRVHKVISRMLEENEKYRHRLKCQRLSSESCSIPLALVQTSAQLPADNLQHQVEAITQICIDNPWCPSVSASALPYRRVIKLRVKLIKFALFSMAL
nr:uncharacterized protein C5orf47 homolog [Aotus nancymaae]